MKRRIDLKSKKNIISIIVVVILAVAIPSSVYAYNSYNYSSQYNLGNKYLKEDKFDEALSSFKNSLKYERSKANEINNKIALVNEVKGSKLVFDNAIKDLEQKEYLEAIDIFKKVSNKDVKRYQLAQDNINKCKSMYISDNMTKAKAQADSKNFDAAVGFLDTVLKFEPVYQEALTLKEQYNKEIEKIKAEEARKEAEKRVAEVAAAALAKAEKTTEVTKREPIEPNPNDPNSKFLVGAKLIAKISGHGWLDIYYGTSRYDFPPTSDLEIYIRGSEMLLNSRNSSIIQYVQNFNITVKTQEKGEIVYVYKP